MPVPWTPWRWPARLWHWAALLVLVVHSTLDFTPWGGERSLADASYDTLVQRRLFASAPDPRLLIVDIDERSLADMAGEFGRWPWPRDTLATLLAHAHERGALAVVFDILFSDPDRLRPGGDQALAAAVAAHPIGLYPVLRLPAALDAKSEVTADRLPGLALPPAAAASAATGPQVAVVMPFLKTVMASGRLGTHNATLEGDGKIRGFAWHERLADGWQLRSMPAAVAAALGMPLAADDGQPRLIVWRKEVDAYPRVPFSTVFACAEGRQEQSCPDLAGRILIVGASASSLHDIQSTPLVRHHAGVDILATLADNALHGRQLRTMPEWLRWLATMAALALAWQLLRSGKTSPKVLIGLPLALMGIAYLSLHTEYLFLDLALPAGAGLALLTVVKSVDGLRRMFLGAGKAEATGPFALVFGSSGKQGEWLERTVFDVGLWRRVAVSGHRSATGPDSAASALWVLWGLAGEEQVDALRAEVARRVPQAWARSFVVGTDPQRSLHAAVLTGLSASREESSAVTFEE